jgi:monoamine oxidase
LSCLEADLIKKIMAHIIIVGAGASGLMAASVLLDKNHHVTLLEARDRVGGRIYTLTGNFSTPIDCGAEFIHGHQALTSVLARQANAQVVQLTGTQHSFVKGALQSSDPSEKEWGEFMEKLQALKVDTTVASFLEHYFSDDRYKDLRQQVKGFAEGFDLADTTKASLFALREEWAENDDEHQYRIEGGYGVLIDYLIKKNKARNIELKLSTCVCEIQWTVGKVKILTGASEVIEGDKVIVTVPLGILKAGMIRFSPSLDQHQTAFNTMGFGSVIKFLVEFNPEFWNNRIEKKFNNVGFIFSDAIVPTWWSQRPSQIPLLTGWLGGPSVQTAAHSKQSLYKNAIDSLCYILQCSEIELKQNIAQYESVNWTDDPYSLGAYAYSTLESHAAVELISKPVNDTIYFAGEAIYLGKAIGTVEAALTSGRHVAAKVQ